MDDSFVMPILRCVKARCNVDMGTTIDPGLYTPKLLTYLESESFEVALFLVRSRALYRSGMVWNGWQRGHELSVKVLSCGGPARLGANEQSAGDGGVGEDQEEY
jgi:hypothetical protein